MSEALPYKVEYGALTQIILDKKIKRSRDIAGNCFFAVFFSGVRSRTTISRVSIFPILKTSFVVAPLSLPSWLPTGLAMNPPMGLKPPNVENEVATDFVKKFVPSLWAHIKVCYIRPRPPICEITSLHSFAISSECCMQAHTRNDTHK